MAGAPQYFETCGRVVEVIAPSKAVVELKYKGKPARALLLYDKIPQDLKPDEPQKGIADLIQVGSSVRFSCHNFDETREDRSVFSYGSQCLQSYGVSLNLSPLYSTGAHGL